MRRFDVIVVGLGAVGSATAYQLAKRGAAVIGLDRYAPPHPFGSTHGDTRITRRAIGEGRAYVPLVLRSDELWSDIQAATGEPLRLVTGGLILGRAGASSTTHGRRDFVGQTIAVAAEFGVEHEVLSTSEIRDRFPQFVGVRDEVGYYEPGAGALFPERCVRSQLALAAGHGAMLLYDAQVVGWECGAGGVTVVARGERYAADRLVLAAGPWIRHLARVDREGVFRVHRQVMCWFDVSGAYECYAPGVFPVFMWDLDGQEIYGLPAVDGDAGGIKVAVERFDDDVDPDRVLRTVTLGDLGRTYEEGVRGRLRGAGPAWVRAQTCLYTCTPDFGFVIDRHPECEAVLIVSACSGHGFKHSAAIGESVAQLLIEGRSDLDLSAFGLARLAPVG